MIFRPMSIFRFAIPVLVFISSAPAADADQTIPGSGVKGGLVVHLGAGDGKTTATLRVNESYIVHGLEADAAKTAAARTYLHKEGLYFLSMLPKYPLIQEEVILIYILYALMSTLHQLDYYNISFHELYNNPLDNHYNLLYYIHHILLNHHKL